MTGHVSTAERRHHVPVVDPAVLEPTEPVSGLSVRTPFRLGGRRLELLEIRGASGYHLREGTVYGWVRDGSGRLEYGPDGREIVLSPGDFLRVPTGLVHRYVVDAGPLELRSVVDADVEATPVDPPGDTDVTSGASEGPGSEPEVVGPDGLVPAVGSPGLVRETPFPGGDALVMRVRAAGGAAAGWHHHGDNVYFGYAVDGPSETEYGPDGREVARIEVGECFHVPPWLVHRDTNPTDEAHTGVIWLCGGEPWVVNVDGPA